MTHESCLGPKKLKATKRGWPHIHIVARCEWLSQKWLSAQMKKLADSPVVDVRRVHNKSKITAYISKYISKNPHRFTGVKRYWCSRDWGYISTQWKQILKRMGPQWEIVHIPFQLYAYLSEHPTVEVEVTRTQATVKTLKPP